METKILWEILSNTSAIATIETRIREELSNWKETLDEDNLRHIDVKMKEGALKDISDSILEEKLDQYITGHASAFQSNIIFSDKEKQDFTEDFLSQHLEFLPYKKEVGKVLESYFEELEKAILKIMQGGQAVIFKAVMDNKQKIESISRKMDKMAGDGHQDKAEAPRINMANDMYCRSFTEPLFLHKNEKDTKVCLENLFILQKYHIIRVQDISDAQENLTEHIEQFLMEEKGSFFFIEGDAGCGKSSLVSFLNYHYVKQEKLGDKLF